MEVMGMSTMDDQPNDFPHAQTRLSKDRKKQLLYKNMQLNSSPWDYYMLTSVMQ